MRIFFDFKMLLLWNVKEFVAVITEMFLKIFVHDVPSSTIKNHNVLLSIIELYAGSLLE